MRGRDALPIRLCTQIAIKVVAKGLAAADKIIAINISTASNLINAVAFVIAVNEFQGTAVRDTGNKITVGGFFAGFVAFVVIVITRGIGFFIGDQFNTGYSGQSKNSLNVSTD